MCIWPVGLQALCLESGRPLGSTISWRELLEAAFLGSASFWYGHGCKGAERLGLTFWNCLVL